MEQGVKPTRGQSGFMLVTVLIITAVGLLFGAGALLLFRYQCQMRIDRQHELEKVYAVRSALNYIRTYTDEIPSNGKSFTYHTGSERDLGLTVKPVEAIFPVTNNPNHFDMRKESHFRFPRPKQYDNTRDYEYGVENWTNLSIKASGSGWGLAFDDMGATNNVRWWVNIGMRGTGGWLQEDYGRRYCFWPVDYVAGTATQDIVRLCIIRNVTNTFNQVGRRHGWPLSEGERALVFEISPKGNKNTSTTNNADMVVYEYWHMGGSIKRTRLLHWPNRPSLCNMGMQLAGDKVSVFYIGNEDTNKENTDLVKNEANASSRGYTFSDAAQMSLDTYNYFAKDIWVGGNQYGGIYTNANDGKVYAPELRAVFEIEAASDLRKENNSPSSAANIDFLTDFIVTPAYQYDVFLEHPASVINRATVAQKIGRYSRSGANYTILTYDTHGTEHKGFRQDEREHARNGR